MEEEPKKILNAKFRKSKNVKYSLFEIAIIAFNQELLLLVLDKIFVSDL